MSALIAPRIAIHEAMTSGPPPASWKMCAQTRFEAEKVRQAGFEPPVPLLEGIERTVSWYLREGRAARDGARPTGGIADSRTKLPPA